MFLISSVPRLPRVPWGVLLVTILFPAVLPCPAAEPLLAPEAIETPSRAIARRDEVIAKTRSLLATKDTAGLEALAAELRTSREQLDGGTWLLSVFYDHAVEVPEPYEPGTAAVAFYEKWANDHPTSITAQVCLISALTQYAWNARGSGWANTVTEARWRRFRERLARAAEVYARARELPEKCPGLASAAQRVALGQGWDRVKYRRLVRDAIAAEPTYGRYYTDTCRWLLPRWYGEPGDFEQWLADEADTYPPEERDIQYARFVWMADRMGISSEMVFAPGRLDWARTRRGFTQWLERQPDNLMVRFEFTGLALLANDRATAAEQFRATGGKYYPVQWKEATFERARQFAFAGGPNPLRREATAPSKAPKKSSLAAIGPVLKRWMPPVSGFLGGLLAGGCLLAIALRRRAVGPGIIAFLACPLLATPFGTAATLIPAVLLGLALLLRSRPALPPATALPGWIVLLWMMTFIFLYVGLQVFAVAFAAIPLSFPPPPNPNHVTDELMRDGTVFRICANAAWINLLALIAVCPPASIDLRRTLALTSCGPVRFFAWVIGVSALFFALNFLEPWLDARTKEAIASMALGLASPVTFFLAVALAAPVVEELIFRGYAISGWQDRLGPWGAILASSALFTACHFQYGLAGLLFIFFFGLVLGVVRWRTGSIYPCIAIHLLNNLAFGLHLYWERGT